MAFVEILVDVPSMYAAARSKRSLQKSAAALAPEKVWVSPALTDPYEPPLSPEIQLDNNRVKPEAAAAVVLNYLESIGLLPKKED